MFTQLLEELLPTLPATPAQLARIDRALAEGGSYTYEDSSAVYEEAAVRVSSLSGNTYLCFPDGHCTCRDWSDRGPVIGTGEIELCKHTIAAYVSAQFVEPAGEAPVPFELPFAGEGDQAMPPQPAQRDELPEPEWDWEEEGEDDCAYSPFR